MAIFVEHKKSHDLFVLISGGFGAYQSAGNSGAFDSVRVYKEGSHPMVCVCDRNGDIGWFASEDIRVIHVDGLDIEGLTDLAVFKPSS